MIPFVIDNDQHRLGDVLNRLLYETSGKPLDIATAYFSISGYRLVKDGKRCSLCCKGPAGRFC
jgi:hypothetical protein